MKKTAGTANRRAFLGVAGTATVAVAFSGLAARSVEAGGHMPKLSPDDPTAKALGYVEESTTEGQMCSNCQLYTGTEGKSYGPCTIFPGKEVAANGWCKSWVKKAG